MSHSCRAAALLACLLAFMLDLGAQDTTVVLVRHAERQSLWDGDSPLSEAGRRRAQALVPELVAFHPGVLFVSDRQRTQQTLAPLAAILGLTPRVWSKDASGTLPAEILRNHRGRTVIVCWHHDLMKQVVRGFGVQGPVPYLGLDTYDQIWIVTIPLKGPARLEARRQRSAPAAAGVAQGRQDLLGGPQAVVLSLLEERQAAELRVGKVNPAQGF